LRVLCVVTDDVPSLEFHVVCFCFARLCIRRLDLVAYPGLGCFFLDILCGLEVSFNVVVVVGGAEVVVGCWCCGEEVVR
jgi:hypothetical protein